MNVFQTDFPLHLFHQGENFNTYDLMGAHAATINGVRGFVFRVWAPHANEVFVVGEFNDWNTQSHPMERMIDGETFELFIGGIKEFCAYKYCIKTADGRTIFKADPYAFHAETPKVQSSNASKIYNLSGYKWSDKAYLNLRKNMNVYTSPVNIYEVNLLSWKFHSSLYC